MNHCSRSCLVEATPVLFPQSRMLFVSFPLPFIFYSGFNLGHFLREAFSNSQASFRLVFSNHTPANVRAVITTTCLESALRHSLYFTDARKGRMDFLLFHLHMEAWCTADANISVFQIFLLKEFSFNETYVIMFLPRAKQGCRCLGMYQCTKKVASWGW